MATRKTSLDAYNAIKVSGLLSERRWQVYDLLYREGPLTGNEVWKRLGAHLHTGSFNTRLNELKKMGAVEEVGHKQNEESGMRAILWDVTGDIPRKFEREVVVERYVVFWPTAKEENPKLFKTMDQAKRYKVKNEMFGTLCDVEDLRRWGIE